MEQLKYYNFKDLTGQSFWDWIVIGLSNDKTASGRPMWDCRCACGTQRSIPTSKLNSGLSKGCGCKKGQRVWEKRFENLIGKRFGKLTVIELSENKYGSNRKWSCKCDCGATKDIVHAKLKSGHTQSCGCMLLFKATHRKSKHRMYRIWQGMMKRCYGNTNSRKNYKELGIVVCPRWHKFENFYDDTKEGYDNNLSLDRHPNPFGNYEPINYRWATAQQQSENKRNTIYITIDGQTKTLMEWSRVSKMPSKLIRRRFRDGWQPKEAVFSPSNSYIYSAPINKLIHA